MQNRENPPNAAWPYLIAVAMVLGVFAFGVAVARSAFAPAGQGTAGTFLEDLIRPLPTLLVIGLAIYILRFVWSRRSTLLTPGGTGQPIDPAHSRASVRLATAVTTKFDDVAGVDEAKEELAEIVDFLKHPDRYAALGARVPKGTLLVGPPGTGKTLLARAVAAEAEVPFLSINGPEFVEIFVGVGASRVRDLFQKARASAPCIVFIDEIDAVGRHRSASFGPSHEERDQTLNQLLVEMDGFDARTNVVVIAATNRPDVLDAALLRPGRFDRQIVFDRPDSKGRLAILRIHARGKPLDEDVDLAVLAKLTAGFSGADLENLLNEAALLAARCNSQTIGHQDLHEAIDRVVAGPRRKSRLISRREKTIMAYHEAGHALVAHVLPDVDPVQKITIVPRGLMGGYTRILPIEDKYLCTCSEFEDTLAWAMGGHAAEQVIFGQLSTGAGQDVERATQIARKMVTEYGMSERVGPVAFGHRGGIALIGREIVEPHEHSDEIAYEIDQEVRKLIRRASKVARKTLLARRDTLVALAEALMEHETLEGEHLESLLGGSALSGKAAEARTEDAAGCVNTTGRHSALGP